MLNDSFSKLNKKISQEKPVHQHPKEHLSSHENVNKQLQPKIQISAKEEPKIKTSSDEAIIPLNPVQKIDDVFVNEVRRMNIPLIKIAGRNIYQYGYGQRSRRGRYTSINPSASQYISEKKDLAKEILRKNGFPVPKGIVVRSEEEIKENIKDLRYPLTVKPRGAICGQGVTVSTHDFRQVITAFYNAYKIDREVIIEEFHEGFDFRVLIVNDRVVAVTKKLPARIRGNGGNTIRELISMENDKRVKGEKTLKPIVTDRLTNRILKLQGYTKDSIPIKNKLVYVRLNANRSTGGEAIDWTDKINYHNKVLCRLMARVLGLKIVGIDVISTDISEPLIATNGAVIEVNSNPGLNLHKYPTKGKTRNASRMILKYLFPGLHRGWIPIKINGKIIRKQKIVDTYLDKKPKMVKMFKNARSKEIITLKRPKHILYTYLLDKLTTEVIIKDERNIVAKNNLNNKGS